MDNAGRRRDLSQFASTAAAAALFLALLLPPPAHSITSDRAPSSHGPFPVGYYNTTVPNAGPGGAPAPATAFYPSLSGGENTPSDASLAPYGTVVFAPGYGASRIAYWPMLSTVAALGYVAFGVDYDPSAVPNTADMATRVGYALDYLEAENASAASLLYTMVDGGRLVSSGHSMGGGLSVLAAAQHPRFDFVLPLSPYILPPLYWPPNLPGDAVGSVTVPMQIIVGSADGTAIPALNADVLYANGNCPKSEFTITGADHVFSNLAHQVLLGTYVDAWLHYYLERDAAVFDTLFGSGAQADVAAGLITYDYCLDTASVTVSPPSAAVLVGASQPFTAAVRDRIGTIWPAAVTWSTAGGIGSVDPAGVFTATAAGVGSVTAERDGISDSALVTTGPEVRPVIRRAFLSGGDRSNLTLEWWKSAADGGPAGPVTYRVLEAVGSPSGPYAQLVATPADGSATYTFTCLGCGHVPGDTAPLFFQVEAVDAGGNATASNLAARYARLAVAGTNLLSIPLEQADGATVTVLQTLLPAVRTARTFVAGDAADPWKAAYAGRSGDLATLSVGQAFWVDLDAPGQFTLAGLVPEGPAIALRPGWNLVSYLSLAPETRAGSLAGLPVTTVEAFASTGDPYALRAVPPSELLLWGEGYWLQCTASATWSP